MNIERVYDLLNYQTTGLELKRLYEIINSKVEEKRVKHGFRAIVSDEGIEVGDDNQLMDQMYAEKSRPESSTDFYPLHYLRQLKIVKIKEGVEPNERIVFIPKEFIPTLYEEHGYQKNLPLSCVILKQFKKLEDTNINKYYYNILGKIIFENRLERYSANTEVNLIQKVNVDFPISKWKPNINPQKYNFFQNVVDYFFFDKATYSFNLRFIHDILVYVLYSHNRYYTHYERPLQEFFSFVSNDLIKLDTGDRNLVFQGMYNGLISYMAYSNFVESQDPKVKLSLKSDVGTVYEFDSNTRYDFIKIKTNVLRV